MRKLLFVLTAILSLAVPAAGAAQSTATVVVVRHAEKAAEPAGDPALTEAGAKRAVHLAKMLRDADVRAVYATQYRRTRDTGSPTAEAAGVIVETVPVRGGIDAHIAAVAAAVRAHDRGTVLVVGHSNTVPAIVAALTGATVAPIDESEYGNVYIIHRDGDTARLVRARY